MLFTEEQIERLNICNSMICKINRGNVENDELNQFISNTGSRISGELPTDDIQLSNERYIQAFEVETLWHMREKIWGMSGIDDILTFFSIRICTSDSLVNNVTRMKELAVLSSICSLWALIPSHLQSVAETLLDDNNRKPLYNFKTSMSR